MYMHTTLVHVYVLLLMTLFFVLRIYLSIHYCVAYSFVGLIKYIFTIPGVKSFLSERISQDPLEKFFGRQRQTGAVNEHPTANQIFTNNQSLRLANSIKIETHKGNTQNKRINKFTEISDTPLPKRKRGPKMNNSSTNNMIMQGIKPDLKSNYSTNIYTCTCINNYYDLNNY